MMRIEKRVWQTVLKEPGLEDSTRIMSTGKRDWQRKLREHGPEDVQRMDRKGVLGSGKIRFRRQQEDVLTRELRRAEDAMRVRLRREEEEEETRQQRNVASAQRERIRRSRMTSAEVQQRQNMETERYHARGRIISAQTRGLARTNMQPDEHYDGSMNVACASCEAKHFNNISIRHFINYPEELRRLLTYQDPEAREFREHIRSYNSAFAFASMGAQLDTPRGHGPYCFRIHGQIHHRIGPALPENGQPHRYGQVYILDTSMAAEKDGTSSKHKL
ncbi:unnamed protein product [Haemonchus placei]|uniref:Helitron_like_N domain-containing protein n=1 Tax=Haemonchus placei TaxID=6290 RepID=A0A0N4XA39_HAEPC|nr:unnamed protein product [Haemonchus placei]